MCHQLLSNPNFLLLLLSIDRDIAEKIRCDGCPCGGRLHAANYPRKPRGGSSPDPSFSLRLSFCCDAEGCRQRSTPPSVRFLGRKVYLGVMVVLVTALRQGPTPQGSAILQKEFGVDRRTLTRWQRWWRDFFPASKFWQVARSRCVGLPWPLEAPHALVVAFRAEFQEGLSALLRFLSPLGGSSRFELQAF